MKEAQFLFDKSKNRDILLLTIILISAKLNERDELLISSLDIEREMGTKCTSRNLHVTEKHIMELLNWNVSLMTILHYVQLYYSTGLGLKSDQIINSQNKKIHIEEAENLSLLSERFIK